MFNFNPLTPLDLLKLPTTSLLKHKDEKFKSDFVQKLHTKVSIQIEKKNESYAKYANKGRKKVVFKFKGQV